MKKPSRLLYLFCLAILLAACASPATKSAPTQAPAQAPTQPPAPTAVPSKTPVPPTATPKPSSTPVPPTATAVPSDTPKPTATVDLDKAIKSQQILLFEDMAFLRWIKPALDKGGYEYTDTGDAIGTFKADLLSSKYDLIIAAAEGRGGIAGEFWKYISDQLDGGTSVILETWTLDSGGGGGLEPIMEKCGITVQANWSNPSDRGVYWADAKNPLANEPNVVDLKHFSTFWVGDVGDLVMKTSDSSAQILASANASSSEKNGLITVCYNGRLLIQTFSTHDHRQADMTKMWQNYVYYMLKNRILGTQK